MKNPVLPHGASSKEKAFWAIHPRSSERGILAFSRKDSLNPELILSGFHIRTDPSDRDKIFAMDHLDMVLTKKRARDGTIQLFLSGLVTSPYSGSHGTVDLDLLHLGQSLTQRDKDFLYSLPGPHRFQVS